jgi:hypothetical protein
VWVGATEPAAWTVSGSDSTAGFQAAGGVGLTPYPSGSSTAAIVTRYDDFAATTIAP